MDSGTESLLAARFGNNWPEMMKDWSMRVPSLHMATGGLVGGRSSPSPSSSFAKRPDIHIFDFVDKEELFRAYQKCDCIAETHRRHGDNDTSAFPFRR